MAFTGAFEVGLLDVTFTAEAVMANKWVAVKLGTSDGQVNLAGDGEEAIGILQTKAAAIGDQVSVRIAGISKVVANGAFSKGDHLNSGAATGKVDTAGGSEYSIAIALEAATAQDDVVAAKIETTYA